MNKRRILTTALAMISGAMFVDATTAQENPPSSYAPVNEPAFKTVMQKMVAEKPAIEKRHADLLAERYDLSDKPAEGVTMFRGKPVQKGVRVKLPEGMTWDQ